MEDIRQMSLFKKTAITSLLLTMCLYPLLAKHNKSLTAPELKQSIVTGDFEASSHSEYELLSAYCLVTTDQRIEDTYGGKIGSYGVSACLRNYYLQGNL